MGTPAERCACGHGRRQHDEGGCRSCEGCEGCGAFAPTLPPETLRMRETSLTAEIRRARKRVAADQALIRDLTRLRDAKAKRRRARCDHDWSFLHMESDVGSDYGRWNHHATYRCTKCGASETRSEGVGT